MNSYLVLIFSGGMLFMKKFFGPLSILSDKQKFSINVQNNKFQFDQFLINLVRIVIS